MRRSIVDRAVSWSIDRYAHLLREYNTKVKPERNALLSTLLGASQISDPAISSNPADNTEKQKQALTVSWIYSAIQLLAYEFSAAQISVKRLEGEQKIDVPNHPFELLLARPNPEIDLTFLWQYTVAWLSLRGDGYWFLSPEAGNPNALAEIWPIQADRMTPVLSPEKYVVKYQYKTNTGRAILIDPNYVVHFMYPNPHSLWRGLSPLGAALLPMETEIGAGKYQRDYYVTGKGIPASVLLLNEDMSDRDFEATVAQLRDDFQDERKVAIARGNDLKVATIGLTQRDMQLLGQREFTRDEIDIIFLGVAIHKASQEAELRQLDKMLKDKKIHPLHVLLSGQLNVQVMRRFYSDTEIVEFEDIRAQDKALNVQERNTYWRVKTFNEARQDLRLPAYHDDVIGNLPVPLATDPAYIAMLQGISRTGLYPGSDGGLLPKPNRREPSGTPAMQQSDAPVNQMTDVAAGRKVVEEATIREALTNELNRWKKVALKEIRAKRNPGAKTFTSNIIPTEMRHALRGALWEAERNEDTVKAIFESFKADKRGGGRGRPSKEIQAVNEYQRELEEAYDKWADQTADKIAEAENEEDKKAVIVAAILLLLGILSDMGRKRIPEALFLAVGENPPSPDMVKKLAEAMAENEKFLNDSLGLALREKLIRALSDPDIVTAFGAGAEEGREAIRAIMATVKARVAMYAGAWWAEYNHAIGSLVDMHGSRVLWKRDELAQHCTDCLEYGDREYDSFQSMLMSTGGLFPASTNLRCGSNCRCTLIELG